MGRKLINNRLCADVLRVLHQCGPCSNADIARRLKVPIHQTYTALGILVGTGLAGHPKRQIWEITVAGKDALVAWSPVRMPQLYEPEHK